MPNRPMTETPDYLHFKHKFGFIRNFTELYQAFYWSCHQREIEIDHNRCEKFFMNYIKGMGFETEFKRANIDPRSFSIEISYTDSGPPAKLTKVNAGRLYKYQKNFLPLIAIKGLTECSLTIDGNVYKLKLEE